MRTFLLPVCDGCLSMLGFECHTPGCAFWMHDTPSPDVVRVLSECVLTYGNDDSRPRALGALGRTPAATQRDGHEEAQPL